MAKKNKNREDFKCNCCKTYSVFKTIALERCMFDSIEYYYNTYECLICKKSFSIKEDDDYNVVGDIIYLN